MNKIKTFEEACKALNITTEVPEVKALPEKHQKAIIAHFKLIIIAQALNEGWEPNWNDMSEWKYYPWMEIEASEKQPSGSGVSDYDYDYDCSSTYVGSRLCFKSRELAKYAGKQFSDLYKEYFLM